MTILGAIIGDMVGSTREWNNVKTEDFELLPAGSRFTDDTVMTLAVAEWLMTDPNHSEHTLIECMQRLGRKYPNAGSGGMFRQWLYTDNPQPYNSFGNGSAMRVSPVGLYANSLEEALELARITASVSHNHPEGIKGAQAIAACVYLRMQERWGISDTIRHRIHELFGYNLDLDLEELRDRYTFDVTCQGSVPTAIMSFLKYSSYPSEKALRMAISMGGDSDTIGAMTASIAAAQPFYIWGGGFSTELEDKCRALLPPDLLDINDRFIEFISKPLKQSYSIFGNDLFFAGEYPGDKSRSYGAKQAARVADCIRGSLMAGAAGDALGYEVEFMSHKAIVSRYGERGITRFELAPNGKALISDDTQMTLFTANGMLMGLTSGYMRGIGGRPEKYVDMAYLDWYYTQTGKKREMLIDDWHPTWLRDLPEMAHLRAPGNTCLSACESLFRDEEVRNNSKGCGGIMRVAPMALLDAAYASRGKHTYSLEQLAEAGGEIAECTHKHPLGFLPAALLTVLLYKLVPLSSKRIQTDIVPIAVETLEILDHIYIDKYETEKRYLRELSEKALRLAHSAISEVDAIRQLGEGWTGEEAWAIALYCAVRHVDSVEEAIIASVNHDGDSDSTGSICGNIMGAIYGYEYIRRRNIFCPNGRELEQTLELSEIILALADDLYTGCIISEYDPIDTPEKQQWYERYCEMQPSGITGVRT